MATGPVPGGDGSAGLDQAALVDDDVGTRRRSARGAASAGRSGAPRRPHLGRLVVGVARHFEPAGHRRCPGSATTPSGAGGRPAIVQSRSAHACRWAPISPTAASTRRGPPSRPWRSRSASPAKLSETTRVTVPGLGDVAAAARVQGVGQPGPADGAEHRVAGQLGLELGAARRSPRATRPPTARAPPGRAAGRTGRWRARPRPDTVETTSAVSATAYGAMRWGAGTSVSRDLRAQPGVPQGADRPGELGGLLARQ